MPACGFQTGATTAHPLAASLLGALLWASVLSTRALSAQTLEGRLVDGSSNDAIPGGIVIMISEDGDSVATALTDEQGRFSVTAPDAGSFLLSASTFGYRESIAGVFELGESGSMELQYRLAPAPLSIDEVVVELGAGQVREPKIVRNGFVHRMQQGFGHHITPHEIEETPDHRTTDLLDRVPGVVLSGSNTETYAGKALRLQGPLGPCEPLVFLDGIRVQASNAGDIEAVAPLNDLEAIEVYTRRVEVPLRFAIGERQGKGNDAGFDYNPCGVVLFWTKS